MTDGAGKPIRLTVHARGYQERRGFTVTDVEETIRTAPWRPARGGRLEAMRDYPFNAMWNGTRYAVRQVRPIFVDERDEIVVITVYTYYF